MNRRGLSRVVVFVWLGLLIGLVAFDRTSSGARADGGGGVVALRAEDAPPPAETPAASAAGPLGPLGVAPFVQSPDTPIERAFRNIQVLKGMPYSQLLPSMHLMRAALGVRCDYCHVAENGKYYMDDKPAKQTARRMIQMVFDINKANFNGQPVVTCNSCHRGQTRPVAIPAIGQAAFANTTRAEPGEKAPEPPPLPSAEEVVNKYVQAVGGRAAVEKISTRVMRASLVRPTALNPSGAPATMEIYQKAPDKFLGVVTTPEGVTYQGFDGKAGWVKTTSKQEGWAKTATKVREMNGAELAQFKSQISVYRELELPQQYAGMKTTGRERVGARDAYVVEAATPEGRTEHLFFDAQTGLLLRRTIFTYTMLGYDPTVIDFSDYRDVGGVKWPFTIQVSSIDNNHNGSTRKFTEVKQNVAVDDAKFEMPPADK